MRTISILFICWAVCSGQLLAQEWVKWDKVIGLAELSPKQFLKNGRGNWGTGYAYAAGLTTTADEVVLCAIIADPSLATGPMRVELTSRLEQSFPLVVSKVDFGLEYTPSNGHVVLYMDGSVVFQFGRIPSAALIEVRYSQGTLSCWLDGRFYWSTNYQPHGDKWSLQVEGHTKGAKIGSVMSELLPLPELVVALEAFRGATAELNGKTLKASDRGLVISAAALKRDGSDKLVITGPEGVENDVQFILPISKFSRFDDATLVLWGQDCGSAEAYIDRSHQDRCLRLRRKQVEVLSSNTPTPFVLTLRNQISLHPNAQENNVFGVVFNPGESGDAHLEVTNSHGEFVFVSGDPVGYPWDGLVEGEVKEGVYHFSLLINGKNYSGQFLVYED